jgi:hypothetical protein
MNKMAKNREQKPNEFEEYELKHKKKLMDLEIIQKTTEIEKGQLENQSTIKSNERKDSRFTIAKFIDYMLVAWIAISLIVYFKQNFMLTETPTQISLNNPIISSLPYLTSRLIGFISSKSE